MKPILKYYTKRFNADSEYVCGNDDIRFEEKWLEGNGKPSSPYRVRITITNDSDEVWMGVVKCDLVCEANNPRFYMPGFMYGRNRGESPIDVPRKYPRIRQGMPSLPASDYWLVRGDRLAMPVSLVYDKGHIYGFDAKPYYNNEKGAFAYYAGYGCSWEEEAAAVSYTLGYENAPWLFVQSTTIYENTGLKEENCIVIECGEAITAEMNIYDYQGENETDIHKVFRNVYSLYHEEPRKIEGFDYVTATKDIAGAISENSWLSEDNMYSGFVWIHEDGSRTYNKLGSLSWTNGLSVAVPMLMAGVRTDNEKMISQAITFINRVVAESMNADSGLPYDAINDGKWSVHGWWFNNMHTGGHSAYLAGQAMYYIMKAYCFEKNNRSIIHDDWLEYVKPVLEVFENNKNSAKEYPFVFSEEDGSGLEYDSMSGAWCLAAVSYYMYLTGDSKYIDGVLESEQHYYDKFVRKSECYGAPLDTDKAIDSEGILAYVRAVRYLHMIRKEEYLLKHLKDGLEYEFTFKFCYNSPVKVPPLSDIGWSSCGGSVTSTANPHIHPMSSTVVDEMLYYYQQTGDEYVLSRMKDTVEWGCQTYNTYDGEYGYGLRGFMSERFCYSEGLVVEKYPDGRYASTWFALMPWAGASIVEGLTGDYWDYKNEQKK